MNDRPEQRPEGRLIAVAQKRARLSGRKAADRAGMSEGHWRAIVSGSRSVAAGTWVAVRAPADTLAVMARVVGVSPERLEEAGRPDAAEELRLIEEEKGPHRSGEAHITMNAELSGSGRRLSPQEQELQLIREIRERVEALERLRDQRGSADSPDHDEEAG